ncbi:MAG: helix-turn-helix transcriptional regulator, partial [Acidimicrobiia bacterium]|nr:helix-turn-helix transcriptional regulator [Acidimicrobiia bacterium]
MPKPSRRNEVLAAALEAFMVKGYEGASVADIVSRLGMSKAAFAY